MLCLICGAEGKEGCKQRPHYCGEKVNIVKFRKKPLKSFNESIIIEGLNMKFRKKPIVIEAIQYTTENAGFVADWCGGTRFYENIKNILVSDLKLQLKIKTLEGIMIANLGDWIIKGIKDEFYPCKNDIFLATYERVEDNPELLPFLEPEPLELKS